MSDNIHSYGDIVATGAFTKSISAVITGATAWPAMLLQHGDHTAAGRCPSGFGLRWKRIQRDFNSKESYSRRNSSWL